MQRLLIAGITCLLVMGCSSSNDAHSNDVKNGSSAGSSGTVNGPAPESGSSSIAVGLENTSDATFSKDVLKSPLPVLLDFYTTWCGPCKTMEPLIQKMAEDYKGKIKVLRIDAEKNPVAAEKYAVTVYPTYCVFVGGKMHQMQYGAKTEDALKQMLMAAHAI